MKMDNIIKLDLSENMFGFPERVIDALSSELEKINLYPDTECKELTECISNYYRVDGRQIYVGNGLDEIIFTIAIAKKYKKVLIPEYSFMGYHFSTKLARTEIENIKLDNYKISLADIDKKIDSTDAIYICNPQNPFGTVLEKQFMIELIEKCEKMNVDLIVDEAYIDFVENDKVCSVIHMVDKYNCLYVLRTFSKAYSLTGLRCGFFVSKEQNMADIFQVRDALPFSVNRFAQKAVCCALEDDQWMHDNVSKCKKNRRIFMDKLSELNISFIESETNFVTLYNENADEICKKLFEKYKIKVKYLAAMGLPKYLRIGIGTEEQMNKVIEVLKEMI